MRMFSAADQRSIPRSPVDSTRDRDARRELLLTADVRNRAAEIGVACPVASTTRSPAASVT